jgi:CheY-like chemotaxis protein
MHSSEQAQPIVLVIEDDESLRKLLRFIIEYHGCQVLDAANGVDALIQLSQTDLPNLILLDMMMPVMNGWQFFAMIKAEPKYKNIPVVIMTAYSKSEISIPENEIVQKPIGVSVIYALIHKYCRVA